MLTKLLNVFGLANSTTISNEELTNLRGQVSAIAKSQGVIEFNMEGTVLTANDIFLDLMGYTLDEAIGKPHSQFVEETHRKSAEYEAFWNRLRHGEFDSGQYKRIGKGGKEVWIEATYNPIFDIKGKPYKVIKYAVDITQKRSGRPTLQASSLPSTNHKAL